MSEYINKYCRGSVWFVNDEKYSYTIGSEQEKSRPWLIISCEAHNNTSTVLNCVPISTGFTERPYQVGFEYKGRPQVIHCENPMSKSVDRFELTGSHYMYQLSDDMMKKVDTCLRMNLGLDSPIDYMLKEVEELIDDLINKKQSQMNYLRDNPVVTEDFLNNFASKIGSLVYTPVPDDMLPTHVEENIPIPPTPIILANSETKENIPVDSENDEVSSRKRMRWTKEAAREFLNKLDTVPASTVAEEYNLKSVKNIYATKHYILKKFGDMRDEEVNS